MSVQIENISSTSAEVNLGIQPTEEIIVFHYLKIPKYQQQ